MATPCVDKIEGAEGLVNEVATIVITVAVISAGHVAVVTGPGFANL